ncbi:MAG: LysM domain-containing protein [Kiritimatiellae bacterium]|nr:LysM domain-containing protein [Kiritimatiellia bacterium]
MLERGKYGVEWTPKPKDEESDGVWKVVSVVVLVALASLAITLFRRSVTPPPEQPPEPSPVVEPAQPEPVKDVRESVSAVRTPDRAADEQSQAFRASEVSSINKRPPKVRNLLMRLEEARRLKDVEMEITTIEALRAMPGSPAADLDNNLAKRLGVLNMRRLFTLKSAQWVETVTVKSGDSASRIASEHGATFASLAKLNDGGVDKLRIGQKIKVLNHPRFNLVVHMRARTADLHLNGKFFKRYELQSAGAVKAGLFEWRDVSLPLEQADRAELDLLLPKSTPVQVSEV